MCPPQFGMVGDRSHRLIILISSSRCLYCRWPCRLLLLLLPRRRPIYVIVIRPLGLPAPPRLPLRKPRYLINHSVRASPYLTSSWHLQNAALRVAASDPNRLLSAYLRLLPTQTPHTNVPRESQNLNPANANMPCPIGSFKCLNPLGPLT